MLSVCIDAQKKLSYYPQNIMFQFYICYHKSYYATWMLLEKLSCLNVSSKTKINLSFGDQAWNKLPTKCWVKDFILPISAMPQIFMVDYGNLEHPKNLKSINNTMISDLNSCRVIPRPAMKRWKKEVFWKIHSLGNLKCNKSNNLKSK